MARERPTASDVAERPADSDQDLAEIVHRAAGIGVPAWRVATALGLAHGNEPSADGLSPWR